MKKCKTLIAVVLLSALPAVAQTVVKVDGVSYALTSDNTAQIDKNEGCKGDVVIPDSIEYEGERYLVNTMVNGAFWGARVSSVSLPDAITTISPNAFYKCPNLRQVRWPARLEVVGEAAFFMCEALESAVLPKGVREIQRSAFWRCPITSLVLGDSLRTIGQLAFSDCKLVTSLVLPATLTSLDGSAFMGCSGLRLIECRREEPLKMKDGNYFANAMKYFGTLRVPSMTRNAYRHHKDWSAFANIEEDNRGVETVDVHIRCNDLGMVTASGRQVQGSEGKTADLWLEAVRGNDLELTFTPVIGWAYGGSETEVSRLVLNGDSITPHAVRDNRYVISGIDTDTDIDVTFSLKPRQLLVRQGEGGGIGIRYGMYDYIRAAIRPREGVTVNALFNGTPELYWEGYWPKRDGYYQFGNIWEDAVLEVKYNK